MKISEIRQVGLNYEDPSLDKVVVQLQSYKSGNYTKLAKRVERLAELEDEVKQLKEEIKQSTREDVADLFDAEDAVKTRVVETVSFIMTLSKDPKATESPKYKDILEALTQYMTPELITVMEGLKKQMVTVTQKAPSLKIKPKLEESTLSQSRFNSVVHNWADRYDVHLRQLKQMIRK